ncbi:MAG: Multidrug export protein MepA [Firmicutes bacterium ADurb.Bin373]|nr:MAG: Multidrug export protein MepA [Firmicutes bacterium ADurb.Bin373]
MNRNDEKIKMMRDEKIPKVLLNLGMPTMIGMLVSAFYNVVDAYFVGGLGTSQMGAVSVTFPIGQIIVGLAMTFGTGAASYISRLLGEGDEKQANKTASTALMTSLLVGVITIIAVLCFLDSVLVSLGATATILPYARAYAMIYIAGSILTIFNVTMNNIITSEGAAKFTMVAMLIGGGLNVIFCPIFIYTLGWGIRGAAIATLAAQAATSLFYAWYISGRKGYLRFSLRDFYFDKTIYAQVFKVGIPILAFQLLASASIGLTNTAASNYGDPAVAAVGIVTRLLALGTFVVFGYMKGLQPVAGYNYGAKNYDRLNEATRVSLKWAAWFCGIMAFMMIVFPDAIVSLFSKDDAMVIDIGGRALRASGIMFVFFGFQMVYGTLFLALGKAKEGGILSISRQGIFFIPVILILPHVIGLNGVIYSQAIADLLTVILTAVLAVKLKKELKGIAEQTA